MSVQPSGTLRTQLEKSDINLRKPPVKNHEEGYVEKISDLDRLERYIIIGSDDGTYYVSKEKLDRQNIQCLDRIIAAGDGLEAVGLIEDVSINRRNVKQNCLLRALAVCARCNDRRTKKAAYSVLSKVCRIPTFLFQFVKFCQEESLNDQGKGWGRAHKKAITEWYRSYKDKIGGPELLARHISKFKKREGWTHKDMLRLAHSKIEDSDEIGFILRYIIKGHDRAKDMYLSEDRMDPIPPSLLKVSDLLAAFDRAHLCREEDELISLIREYKLTWEQCPTQFLKSREVWKSLLPHMPIEAMIKNLGKMTSHGVFPENSYEEEMACKKIRSINKMSGLQEQSEDMETEDSLIDIHMGSANGDFDKDDIILKAVQNRIGKNFYHPFKILIGLVTYRAGKGEKGQLTWIPNQKIIDALDDAFYTAFEVVVPTKKKYYLAIDVSGSMSQPVLGDSTITCAMAAAAMTMMTIRTENEPIVKGFSHEMREIDITREDKLYDVLQKVDKVMMGATDCALPMIDAIEQRMRDIDIFVIYTDNETWYGKCHPMVALQQYRSFSGKKDAKLAVCGMCATEFSIADSSDPNMLDIVGFDSAAPRVLSWFASGRI